MLHEEEQEALSPPFKEKKREMEREEKVMKFKKNTNKNS